MKVFYTEVNSIEEEEGGSAGGYLRFRPDTSMIDDNFRSEFEKLVFGTYRNTGGPALEDPGWSKMSEIVKVKFRDFLEDIVLNFGKRKLQTVTKNERPSLVFSLSSGGRKAEVRLEFLKKHIKNREQIPPPYFCLSVLGARLRK